ncbi:hypothetical protein EBB59_10945 [Lysobacter pythonis]|uniref:Uncharacterized protein n=2 Tax=Solilutibacter pythonis TaxID=2483112 RepID=A0A3M2HQ97_9GAMM|nr:hypothetical protein EBB59_10945 [Lysobacter pythonis]
MLRDYPEHIVRLQEVLNSAIDPTKTHLMPFDEAIWALEGALEAFIDEARDELQAAEASGDPVAIERAKAKKFLMGQTCFKGRWIGDEALWVYFQTNKDAFE